MTLASCAARITGLVCFAFAASQPVPATAGEIRYIPLAAVGRVGYQAERTFTPVADANGQVPVLVLANFSAPAVAAGPNDPVLFSICSGNVEALASSSSLQGCGVIGRARPDSLRAFFDRYRGRSLPISYYPAAKVGMSAIFLALTVFIALPASLEGAPGAQAAAATAAWLAPGFWAATKGVPGPMEWFFEAGRYAEPIPSDVVVLMTANPGQESGVRNVGSIGASREAHLWRLGLIQRILQLHEGRP